MKLQTFIQSHSNWRELLEAPPYCLKIKQKDKLLIFNYNQLESDFFNPIVRESRGVILEENSWKVICRAFDKFFNAEESYSDLSIIDWETAQVQEKIDGSLIKLFYYDGKWRLATNGTIDAFDASANEFSTFGDLFLKALPRGLTFEDLCNKLEKSFTYIFELATCENQVVIHYEGYNLYYLGARCLIPDAQFEANYFRDLFKFWGFNVPQLYPFTSYEAIKALAESLDKDHEGFIICDNEFHRVKVKSLEWLKAHYMCGNHNLGWESLIKIVLDNETAELLAYAPEYNERINRIKTAMDSLKIQWEQRAEAIPQVNNRKELAKLILSTIPDSNFRAFVFASRNRGESFTDFTSNWPISKWKKVLNLG